MAANPENLIPAIQLLVIAQIKRRAEWETCNEIEAKLAAKDAAKRSTERKDFTDPVSKAEDQVYIGSYPKQEDADFPPPTLRDAVNYAKQVAEIRGSKLTNPDSVPEFPTKGF